jgi:hypothetical protein
MSSVLMHTQGILPIKSEGLGKPKPFNEARFLIPRSNLIADSVLDEPNTAET